MTPAMQIQRIVVPVDFSTDSEAAAMYALQLARALRASITLLHVVHIPPAMVGIVPGGSIEGDLATDTAETRVRVEALADALRAELPPSDTAIAIEGAVVPAAAAAEAIVDFAVRDDLIVMSTHSHSAWSNLVVGHVTEKVLRTAPCPVMTIRFPRDHR
jgi:nucleotide-binding universal stress UspA family protein